MDRRAIKEHAEKYYQLCSDNLIKVSLVIGLITLLPTIINSTNVTTYTDVQQMVNSGQLTLPKPAAFLSVIISILLIPMAHGYIVACMKAVTRRAHEVNISDGFVGITRYFDLITTYILKILFIFAFTVVPVICSSFLVMLFLTMGIQTLAGILMIVIFGLMIFLLIRNTLAAFATEYLLEDRQLRNTKAVGESVRLMNGHKMELLKLYLSYIPWYLLQALIIGFIESFCAGLLVNLVGEIFATYLSSVVGAIVGAFFAAYTYMPKMRLALMIFYQELAYRAYR